jgi:sugar/nucleoside kinase (ribokinase family)
VVKISDEEVEFLFGLGVEEGAQYILDTFGVKLVFVTCGADGCFFKNAVASGKVPSLKGIKVIDTTGAGDIFGGSAVSRLLDLGKDIADLTDEDLAFIGRFATTSASLSTEHSGGIPSIQKKDVILERMKTL